MKRSCLTWMSRYMKSIIWHRLVTNTNIHQPHYDTIQNIWRALFIPSVRETAEPGLLRLEFWAFFPYHELSVTEEMTSSSSVLYNVWATSNTQQEITISKYTIFSQCIYIALTKSFIRSRKWPHRNVQNNDSPSIKVVRCHGHKF